MERRYELLADGKILRIIIDFFKGSLKNHKFEERLHISPSGGPEVYEYIRGEEILSLSLDDSVGSQFETKLTLESETDIADFYPIISEAIVSFHSAFTKKMVSSIPDKAERRKLMDELMG